MKQFIYEQLPNGVPVIHLFYSGDALMLIFQNKGRAEKHLEDMRKYVPMQEHRIETCRVEVSP